MNELMRRLLFLPEQASTIAQSIDTLHYTVIVGTMIGASLVFLIAIAFVVRYRAGDAPYTTTPEVHAPLWLETLFIVGTLVLFLAWWQVGFVQFVRLATAPADSIEVYVSAKQWMWRFAYPEGATSIAVLYVPAGRPVKLIMTSRDVIHSFFVPDFRVKKDVVPGHYTTLWFEAKRPGAHEILCAEYCGTDHSMMRGQVIVLSPSDYGRFIRGITPPAPATEPPMPPSEPFVVTEQGAPQLLTSMVAQGQIAAGRWGCLRCHTVDGSPHIGPTWVGLYGSLRRFEDGTSAIADEGYLTASMMDPRRQIVAGFKPVMPTYQGLLQPAETAAIVEYIKSLAHAPGGARVLPDVPVPASGPAFVPAEAPHGR
jgi:cytochrome c oxidase subunit 2